MSVVSNINTCCIYFLLLFLFILSFVRSKLQVFNVMVCWLSDRYSACLSAVIELSWGGEGRACEELPRTIK